jgi:hypothetical protein
MAVAMAGGALSAITVLGEDDPGPYQPGQGQASGALIGLTASALVIGAMYLWKALRGGPNERFEVRERGLVYTNVRSVTICPWDHLAYIRIRKGPGADPISHYFGSQHWCSIAVKGRRRPLKFNGLTYRYALLSAALTANCAPAPRRTRKQRLLWLGLALASGATFAFLIYYINTNSDTELRIDHGDYVEIVNDPGMSNPVAYGVATGLVITAVLVIASFVMFWRKD